MKHADRWLKQMEFDKGFAEQMLLDSSQVRPMFVLHGENRVEAVLAALLLPETKAHLYRFLKMLIVARDLVGFSAISEAWMRRVDNYPGETAAAQRARVEAGPRPSEAEDRIEVVSITLIYRDDGGERRAMQSHREILRGDDAKPIGLKDDDDDYASATAEGGLLDILLEDPPSDEVRKLARATVAVAGQRMMRTLGIVEVPI